MRIAGLIVAALALAAIAISAGTVIVKDYEPRLSLQVKGVPGYIYYNRDYKLTLEYANHGGAVDGPIQISVALPETFALAEHIADPHRHGDTLRWTIDGLGTGESGSIEFSVRGTLPADLTNAVYDLPGYVGHTAFVEGFELTARIEAGSSAAEITAIADTGATTRTVTIAKACSEATQDLFDVYIEGILLIEDLPCPSNGISGTTALGVPGGPYQLTETLANSQELTGWTATFTQLDGVNACTTTGMITLSEEGTFCLLMNTRVRAGTLQVTKVCVGSQDGLFDLWRDDGGSSISVLTEDLACGQSRDIPGVAAGEFLLDERSAGSDTLEGYNVAFGGAPGDDCDASGRITVVAGESVQCTITNTMHTGTVIIRKVTQPASPASFSFTDTIPGCDIGSLADGEEESCTVAVGTGYTVTESDPSALGYALTGISCESSFPTTAAGTGDVATRTATINVTEGEIVTCTFTNVPVSTPTPTPTLTPRPNSTATPTAAATGTATPTATPTATSVVDDPERRGGLGALFAPRPSTPTPVQQPGTAAPATGIRPPSTGDGGLH